GAGCRSDVRLLFLRAIEQRSDPPPFPERRAARALAAGDGAPRPAVGRSRRALLACQVGRAAAAPCSRSAVAVQPRSVPPPVSAVVPGERSPDPRTLSAHASLGAIRESARCAQGRAGVPVSRAARATVEPRRS